MATINLPFAASATRRAPTTDELANGYGCGDADKQLFDWLAWWETAQIARAISKSGLTVDDTDVERLAKAIRSSKLNYVATVGGTANALTATLDPAITAYVEILGTPLRVKIATTNTSTVTVAINGLPATSVVRSDGTALRAGDLIAGQVVVLGYDGTNFQVQGLSSIATPPRQLISYGTAGTFNWTSTLTGWVYIKGVAGGGGGGGAGASATWSGGGGGAGGAFEGWMFVTLGQVIPIVVGAGGGGGANSNGAFGTSGGVSSVNGVMSATGGAGGNSGTTSAAGGAGGQGSGGQINYNGGSGGSGLFNNANSASGFGGSSLFGGGGQSTTLSTTAAAQAPGSGGGGIWNGGSSQNGGVGKDGLVLIFY